MGHLHHIPPTRRRDHHGTEGRKLSEPEAVEDQTATASSEHDRITSAPDLTTAVVACMTHVLDQAGQHFSMDGEWLVNLCPQLKSHGQLMASWEERIGFR